MPWKAAAERLHGFSERITLIHSLFSDIAEQLQQHGVSQVDGILVDLGVSSYQLDTASRGFGFRSTGPLDMRMNQAAGETAADLLDQWGPQELADVLGHTVKFPVPGNLPIAYWMPELLGNWKRQQIWPLWLKIGLLLHCGSGKCIRQRWSFRHSDWQSIGNSRNWKRFLSALPAYCVPGRLAVISFHSLEDRRVKWALKVRRPVAPGGAGAVADRDETGGVSGSNPEAHRGYRTGNSGESESAQREIKDSRKTLRG